MKVYYKVLITLCCFLLVNTLDAQVVSKRRWFADFRAGLNATDMDGKGANGDVKMKLGFHLGTFVSYRMYDGVQLQSGILLTKKGLKQEQKTETYNPSTTERIVRVENQKIDANYAIIPLMIGYESDTRKVSFIQYSWRILWRLWF